MISTLGRGLNRVARRWMPDPFVLAVLLTFVVLLAGVGMLLQAGQGLGAAAVSAVGSWKRFVFAPPPPFGKGLLYFAFQMCLMLVTGHALASSPPVARFVRRLARLPRTFEAQVTLVAFVACAMALVHWGLGLIVGAMIAREVGRQAALRGIPHHYPLLGAAGYTGLMIWGGGLSGSIPLAAASQRGIPLEQTLFSGLNLTVSLTLLIAIPLLCRMLIPADHSGWTPCPVEPEADEPEAPAGGPSTPLPLYVGLGLAFLVGGWTLARAAGAGEGARAMVHCLINAGLVGLVTHRMVSVLLGGGAHAESEARTPAERLERSPLLLVALAALGLVWLEYEFLTGAFKLSFNSLNFAFLFMGLLFQGSAIRYVHAVGEGARGCAGIILQFPLYFGILGVMVVTGLGGALSAGMAAIANEVTYPLFTYLSAGFVNLFVPSGGGQWVVQGKIVIDAATAAGFPEAVPKAVMALTYGDAWTNMLQPFWAVPLLAITGLKARDIIGYTATVMILGGALTLGLLAIL